MIVPVNVAPHSLPAPTQTQQAARQQLAFSSPDLGAAPSLKKSARLQARSMTISNPGQELVVAATSTKDSSLSNVDRHVNASPDRLLAQATTTPAAPAFNNGMPSDIPPLEQIPTLQPQTQELPAVPTSKPESVMPQSNNGAAESQPQQPTDGVVQNGQTFPQPSQVLPQTPSQPSQQPQPSGVPPTGVPAQEPSNYLNNRPGNSAPYYNQNYIGPAISFGRDTTVGAVSRFGLGKNISVRPSLFLGSNTRIAVPITYDFGFNNNEQFEANPLLVFHAGAGLDYSSGGGSGGNGSRLNPLIVAGADVYFGDGASVLVQIGNAFDSNFVGIVGVGLQF
jgi:hypothetical protein